MKIKEKFQIVRNIRFLYFLLTLLVIIFDIISVTIGVADITVADTFQIIWSQITRHEIATHITKGQQTIILNIRIPRILMAILTGMNLAVTGAVYQSIFRNDMADPYILGISSGASLGAAIGFMTSGFSPIYAFVGALVANVLVIGLSGMRGKVSTIRLLLSGLAINYFFSALLALIKISSQDKLLTIFTWGMGSLGAASYERVIILTAITVPTFIIFLILRKELNILLMGEDAARSLGLDVGCIRKILLGVSSILIATTVAFTGTIGFVGLIIPHVAKLIFGSNYRKTLPISAFLGMIFLLLCDNLSRALIPSGEIPIGIITALLGAPYFMYLIYRQRKREQR